MKDTESIRTQLNGTDYVCRVSGIMDTDTLLGISKRYGKGFEFGEFFEFAVHGNGTDHASRFILDHPSTDWFVPIGDVMVDNDTCAGILPYGVISWTSDGCWGNGWLTEIAKDKPFDREYVFEIVTDDDAFERETCVEASAMFVPVRDIDERRFDAICDAEVLSAFTEWFKSIQVTSLPPIAR